jgi:hypothetical protein
MAHANGSCLTQVPLTIESATASSAPSSSAAADGLMTIKRDCRVCFFTQLIERRHLTTPSEAHPALSEDESSCHAALAATATETEPTAKESLLVKQSHVRKARPASDSDSRSSHHNLTREERSQVEVVCIQAVRRS